MSENVLVQLHICQLILGHKDVVRPIDIAHLTSCSKKFSLTREKLFKETFNLTIKTAEEYKRFVEIDARRLILKSQTIYINLDFFPLVAKNLDFLHCGDVDFTFLKNE